MKTKFKKISFLLGTITIVCLFVWTGRTATTAPVPNGITFYSNHCRDDLQMAYCSAIDRAQESIHLSIYTLTDTKVLRSLNNAAENGVGISVIYDGKNSYGLGSKLHPNIERYKRKGSGLMHHKILVIDGKEVWIGSSNLTYESLRMHGNLVIAFESPLLAKTLIETISDRLSRAPPIHTFQIDEQTVEYYQLPKDKTALPRLLTLLNGAKSTISVAMFTWTHPQLTQAIIDAHNRGVDVEVIIDRYQSRGAGKQVVELLTEADVPTRLSDGEPLLHHKMAWIDETTLVCGSANWTRSAFTRNDDCFIILHDLTEGQRAYLAKMWHIIKLESSQKERL